jgi:hypothetical protein
MFQRNKTLNIIVVFRINDQFRNRLSSQRQAKNSHEDGGNSLFQNACKHVIKYTDSLLSIYTFINVETSL